MSEHKEVKCAMISTNTMISSEQSYTKQIYIYIHTYIYMHIYSGIMVNIGFPFCNLLVCILRMLFDIQLLLK
jgi:hypothetical protein